MPFMTIKFNSIWSSQLWTPTNYQPDKHASNVSRERVSPAPQAKWRFLIHNQDGRYRRYHMDFMNLVKVTITAQNLTAKIFYVIMSLTTYAAGADVISQKILFIMFRNTHQIRPSHRPPPPPKKLLILYLAPPWPEPLDSLLTYRALLPDGYPILLRTTLH